MPVIVLGTGRAGRALLRGLRDSGAAASAVRGRSSLPDPERDQALRRAALVILAVPDDALVRVSQDLSALLSEAREGSTRRVFLHLSGALPSSVLSALSPAGAVGSFHPLQTFTGDSSSSPWTGVTVAIEGDDEALAVARALATVLGANPVDIEPAAKPLYHMAASLAANGAVGLLGAALEALMSAGFTEAAARAALQPLVIRAVAATFEKGARSALTGPVARGDETTLEAHRRAILAWDPARLALYEALVREQELLTRSVPRESP